MPMLLLQAPDLSTMVRVLAYVVKLKRKQELPFEFRSAGTILNLAQQHTNADSTAEPPPTNAIELANRFVEEVMGSNDRRRHH